MSDTKRHDRYAAYIAKMRPVFKERAVHSDETEYYRTPFEPKSGDTVTVRIRTAANNVDAVWFISGAIRERMTLDKTQDGFDYYSYSFTMGKELFFYYFELNVGPLVLYYNKFGITRDLADRNAFRIMPGFSTPAWARGAVMYQIFPDRFNNGGKTHDVRTDEYAYIDGHTVHVDDWYKTPENMDVRNFYGGDLKGIEQKLDYLKSLGVEVLYLNPIFVSPSNHKYDIQDYDHIDPHLAVIVNDGGLLL